jgi:hypothetical protein
MANTASRPILFGKASEALNKHLHPLIISGEHHPLGRPTSPHAEEGHESLVRPEPEWVRGVCPECGEVLISNMYYLGGHGYLLVWECWASLGETPKCAYRRVL